MVSDRSRLGLVHFEGEMVLAAGMTYERQEAASAPRVRVSARPRARASAECLCAASARLRGSVLSRIRSEGTESPCSPTQRAVQVRHFARTNGNPKSNDERSCPRIAEEVFRKN